MEMDERSRRLGGDGVRRGDEEGVRVGIPDGGRRGVVVVEVGKDDKSGVLNGG